MEKIAPDITRESIDTWTFRLKVEGDAVDFAGREVGVGA